jgi:hypothetical protein
MFHSFFVLQFVFEFLNEICDIRRREAMPQRRSLQTHTNDDSMSHSFFDPIFKADLLFTGAKADRDRAVNDSKRMSSAPFSNIPMLRTSCKIVRHV